jgi:hypothetical protein
MFSSAPRFQRDRCRMMLRDHVAHASMNLA